MAICYEAHNYLKNYFGNFNILLVKEITKTNENNIIGAS